MIHFILNIINNKKLKTKILSTGSVPGLIEVSKNFNDFEIKSFNDEFKYTNASYSWISSNIQDSSNSEMWMLFAVIWFLVLFIITFYNVGLTSLLFLLEVGLVTPIAAMSLLGIVPITSLLYLLNAITMEAVTGVIIALCFTKDYNQKDFRLSEFLEGSFIIFFFKKNYISNKIKKNHSW